MKGIFTIFLCCFLLQSSVMAQPGDGQRLEALKIAYLTKKLNLTTDEAQRFWPVYNAYIADMKRVKADERNADELEKDEKILAVRKKYQQEFSKALSPDRANQFFKAEKEFYGFVAKELQERRQQRQELRQERFRNRNF